MMTLRIGAIVAVAVGLAVSGCTSYSAHETLTRALHKTFEAEGYNYRSTLSLTKLALRGGESNASAALEKLYLEKGIELVRGITISAEGAVDIPNARSEATYDLRYSQNNVDVSIKLPVLADYATRKLYLGKSFLNTLFPLPQKEERLIRFDLNDTFFQQIPGADFNAESFRIVNDAIRAGTLKSLSDMNHSLVTGSSGRLRVDLDRNRSIETLLAFADAAMERLHAGGMLTPDEYESYRTAERKEGLRRLLGELSLKVVFDIGIDRSGRIGEITAAADLADATGEFTLGIENVSTFTRYNTPLFTIDPEKSGSIDFREVFKSDDPRFPPVETIEKILQHPADVNDALG